MFPITGLYMFSLSETLLKLHRRLSIILEISKKVYEAMFSDK